VQTEEGEQTQNDRLVGVSLHGFEYTDVKTIEDLQDSFFKQMTDFLVLYNKDSGKDDKVTGVQGPERAMELLQQAIGKFKD
jgi:inorganic pyrophosphatase